MLVIFDCDGVLVDSELLAAKVFSAQLKSENIFLSDAACYNTFKGHTLDYCLAWLEKKFQKTLSGDFLEQLEGNTRRTFADSLQPVVGVQQVLHWLRARKVQYCVASNGGIKKINASLEISGLAEYFSDNIFSAQAVQKGKPAPDLYLYAAEKMGVSPRYCIVIEDSITGVRAALSANMRVLLYAPPNPSPLAPSAELAKAKVERCQSMQQVLSVLSGMAGKP